jgi:hypothetical protein
MLVLGVLLCPTKSEAIGGAEWQMESHGYAHARTRAASAGSKRWVKEPKY